MLAKRSFAFHFQDESVLDGPSSSVFHTKSSQLRGAETQGEWWTWSVQAAPTGLSVLFSPTEEPGTGHVWLLPWSATPPPRPFCLVLVLLGSATHKKWEPGALIPPGSLIVRYLRGRKYRSCVLHVLGWALLACCLTSVRLCFALLCQVL